MRACCEKLRDEGVGERQMKVKASGGVRTLADARVMLEAGAERLGTSGGVGIAREGKGEKEGTASGDY
jgi:deoxyribose-phosphate aldolase